MKKMLCILLALMFLLCGCTGAAQSPETTAATQETEPVELEITVPTLAPNDQVPGPVIGQVEGDELAFANPAVARVNYTGNRSYIKYVTSVQELPPEGQLQGYDDAFFEKYALLVVVETVSSGSVRLELERVTVSDGTATVRIKRTMSGEVGTTDMATWMLWAQVEKGLEYNWTLANSTNLPAGEKY